MWFIFYKESTYIKNNTINRHLKIPFAPCICFSGARKNILLTQILICVENNSNRFFARNHSGCIWLASSKSWSCAFYIVRKFGKIFKSLQIPVRAWRAKSGADFFFALFLIFFAFFSKSDFILYYNNKSTTIIQQLSNIQGGGPLSQQSQQIWWLRSFGSARSFSVRRR